MSPTTRRPAANPRQAPVDPRQAPANARQALQFRLLFDMLASRSNGQLTPDTLEHIQSLREQSRESSMDLDLLLAQEIQRLRVGLGRAQESQEELKKVLEKLTAPPLHPAVFLGWAEITDLSQAAMVSHGSARLLVNVAETCDPASVDVGDEVLLGSELNVLVRKSPREFLQGSETAAFERYENGRAVLRSRDEELVVSLGGRLRCVELKAGDLVRWDRNAAIALEKIERSKGDEYILTEYPDESFDNIGGLGRQIHELQQLILLHFLHPEMAEKYGLRRRRAVTLIGPPGTGKTMLARALAAWLGTRFGTCKPRFMHIKPSSLNSYWFSKSEANYREVFRIAREAGAEDPSVPFVIFFDEVDAVAGHRGHSLMRVDDRVLTAFMAELDGLEPRGNILVIAATNRQDSLDPAILRPGRLGDLILEVPRPNRQAAQAIFCKYLEPHVPYRAQNGHDPGALRTELIESAVSRLYDPNAENDLANLTFRDGTQRMVRARDLVSGANISKIAGDARERACRREVETGEGGVTREDLLLAVNEELDCMSRMLTPANCRSYLADLPTDLDVVRVDSVRRRRVGSLHYLPVD